VAPRDRGRTTVLRFLHALVDLQLLEVVDDAGNPIPRGTFLPPGTVPRYRVLADVWTPEIVDRLRQDPAWAERLELAWTAHQLGAPDPIVGCWLRRRPAGVGDAALRAWCARALAAQRRQRDREAAAVEAAIDARDRGHDPKIKGPLDRIADRARRHCTPPVDGLTTVSRPTGRDGASGEEEWSDEDAPIARGDRALERTLDHDRWLKLDRQDVADRLAKTITEVGRLREDWVRRADAIGESRLDEGWRQARNVARRCGVTLSDVVGRFERACDQVDHDIQGRIDAGLRKPVDEQHRFAWGIVRRGLGLGGGRTCRASLGPRPAPCKVWLSDADGSQPERDHQPQWRAFAGGLAAAERDADRVESSGGAAAGAFSEPASEVGERVSATESAPRRRTRAELDAVKARALAAYRAART
jgi:hypothetical protein